ncbi:unnamed protein product [Blepharisma stoltei]|uniref:non-specific serine/threonine protein kinase n=1 Tax=Blepharisma stoltei TaxID=1481888 RepID=A0AAU9JSV8_9CILI|nr:unnamed protein product [Blepharisma stoltei]
MGCLFCLDRPPENLPQRRGNPNRNQEERRGSIQLRRGTIRNYYDIVKTIGTGGFGTVFKVIDNHLGVERALKEIQKSKVGSDHQRKMMQEIEILKEINHPNIMKVYAVLDSETCYYIVTELLTGGELFEKVLSEMRFSENKAAKYLRDIMNAISYCHSKGIVHRDLKPENLLLATRDPDSPLKVIDFGISQRLIPGSKFTNPVGTLLYMAPEVFSGSYDHKCDIWSAGVILYLMLSGRPPFVGITEKEAINSIKACKLDMDKGCWKTISNEAKDLVSKMICVNPAERLNAERVLNHPWIKTHANNNIAEIPIKGEAKEELEKFSAQTKLKKSIYTFIAAQVTNQEERAQLESVFRSLDKNNSGKLTEADLANGSAILGLSHYLDVEEVMKNCDMDERGYIDYVEFLNAASNWDEKSHKDQLKKSFQTYASGVHGKIAINDLKSHVPGIENTEWNQFLIEADRDRDGAINLEELKVYLENKGFL